MEISFGFGAAVVGEDASGAEGIAEQALRVIMPRNNRRNMFCKSNLHNMRNQRPCKGAVVTENGAGGFLKVPVAIGYLWLRISIAAAAISAEPRIMASSSKSNFGW